MPPFHEASEDTSHDGATIIRMAPKILRPSKLSLRVPAETYAKQGNGIHVRFQVPDDPPRREARVPIKLTKSAAAERRKIKEEEEKLKKKEQLLKKKEQKLKKKLKKLKKKERKLMEKAKKVKLQMNLPQARKVANASSKSRVGTPRASTVLNDRRHSHSKIKFTYVEIREYDRCLGDNPDALPDGPSLSLDWQYCSKSRMSVDAYERFHPYINSKEKKRPTELTGDARRKIILEHTDCTAEDIQENMNYLAAEHRQRRNCENRQRIEKLDIFMESCVRKFLRLGTRPLRLRPTTTIHDSFKKPVHRF